MNQSEQKKKKWHIVLEIILTIACIGFVWQWDKKREEKERAKNVKNDDYVLTQIFTTESTDDTTATSQMVDEPEDYTKLYAGIIEMLSQGYTSTDFSADFMDSEIAYTYIDIDKNGVDELLILALSEYDAGCVILDAYTVSKGELQHLFSSMARDRFYLCKDGVILEESSGGAMYSTWIFYSYRNGELSPLECYDYSESYWTYTYYDANGKENTVNITENEAETGINAHQYETLGYTLINSAFSDDSEYYAEDYTEYYNDAVLKKLFYGYSDGWSRDDFLNAEFSDAFGGYSLEDILYAYYDIDKNGVEELLILESMTYSILDAYTIDGGELVHLLSSSDRDRFYLCENGVILEESSGGAMYSTWFFYSYHNGELSILEWYDYSDTLWTHTYYDDYGNEMTDVITEEEAIQGMDTYLYAVLEEYTWLIGVPW